MACSVDIGSRAVDGSVDSPSGFIRRAWWFAISVSARDGEYEVYMHGVIREKEHIRYFEETKVHGKRICPKEEWVFWVADGDVAGHAFGVAVAGPVTEDGSHVVEGPEAVGGEGWECRDS